MSDEITVCDNCLQASCWQGIVMCEEAKSAGTVTLGQATYMTSKPKIIELFDAFDKAVETGGTAEANAAWNRAEAYAAELEAKAARWDWAERNAHKAHSLFFNLGQKIIIPDALHSHIRRGIDAGE